MNRERALYRDLNHAQRYDTWVEIAGQIDQLSGAGEWREDDRCHLYDDGALRSDITSLRNLREREDALALARMVTESTYRHLWELRTPDLYTHALMGTKHLVERFLDEVETALNWMADHEVPGLTQQMKLARFESALHNTGRSGLMLSGGATWGFAHLGVAKGLFELDLLPSVLSGASTGAMVAAGICTRTNEEITALYADLDALRLDGLSRVPWSRALKKGAMLDPGQLADVLQHNVGDMTFAEAHAHSGRSLFIPVSPTRTRQRPRVLNRYTTPEVLVRSGALASSALPALFPPVQLSAKDHTGAIGPYIEGERWADGSLSQDLPKLSLSRLQNVNYFIVSQVNPHVLWLVRHQAERGVLPSVSRMVGSTVRSQLAQSADLLRRATRRAAGPLSQLSDRAYAIVSQEYAGDANIHPRFAPALYRKVVTNPSRADLDAFIQAGERAAWQRVPMIRNQTRIERALERCITRIQSRLDTPRA